MKAMELIKRYIQDDVNLILLPVPAFEVLLKEKGCEDYVEQ